MKNRQSYIIEEHNQRHSAMKSVLLPPGVCLPIARQVVELSRDVGGGVWCRAAGISASPDHWPMERSATAYRGGKG